MTWERNGDNTRIIFWCDMLTCEHEAIFDIVSTRAGAGAPERLSDFAVCFAALNGLGWRSFKRAGRDWQYFCPQCGPAAETAHQEYNRQVQERERIKARNAY